MICGSFNIILRCTYTGVNYIKFIFIIIFLFSLIFNIQKANTEDSISASVVNLSEMNAQIKVTDLVCNVILHDDLMDAKSSLPISLCKDEEGFGQVELFIKIGCTKNKTITKKKVTDGKKIPFLPTK